MTDIDAYDHDDFGLRFNEDKPFGEDEPQSQTQKANGKHRKAEPGKEGGKPNLPEIQIVAADLERIVDQAEAALIAADRGLYQRDGDIVRIGDAKIETASSGEIVSKLIREVGISSLTEYVCSSANLKKYVESKKSWVSVNPPEQIIKILANRGDRLRLPVITGITHVPVIRKDGSVSVKPGYDDVTGLYLDPHGTIFPKLAKAPSEKEARQALSLLLELLTEFPFVSEADRAVAVSAILTTVCRRSLNAAPMHAFTSPVMGSGKSFLVDIASVIGTGREASVIAQGQTPEETEKRLGAILRYGDPLISIDNCEQPVGGEFLCQLLTQPIVRVRILGLSEAPELSTNAMVFCTGNNLTVSGDMSRRMILCSLDPKHERPELREFKRNPVDIIKADRGLYVHGALTILRAYRQAKGVTQPKPLASFEDWSETVRGALIWLGMADPVATMELVRESDTKLEELATVLTEWEEVLRSERMSVAQIIKTADKRETSNFAGSDYQNEGLRDALLTVAGAGGDISPKRLGKWLSANKDRIVGSRLIRRDAVFEKVAHWKLVKKGNA